MLKFNNGVDCILIGLITAAVQFIGKDFRLTMVAGITLLLGYIIGLLSDYIN